MYYYSFVSLAANAVYCLQNDESICCTTCITVFSYIKHCSHLLYNYLSPVLVNCKV